MTRAGRAIAVGAALLYAAGWALGYPEFVALAAVGAALLALAVPWVVRRPKTQIIRGVDPVRVTRGDPSRGLLTVTNVARVRVGRVTATDPVGHRRTSVEVPPLRAGQSVELEYPLATDRRGVFEVGPVDIVRADPLGLLRRVEVHETRATLFVHPVAHRIPPIPVGKTAHIDGPTNDTAPRGVATFHALREYERGDDLRHIHWRATAHTGTLMVREYVDTSEPYTAVVLHCDPAVYTPESFEEAVDIAASIAHSSAVHRYPLRLYSTSGVAVVGSAGDGGGRFLDALAGVEMTPGGLDRVSTHLRQHHGGSSLVVISGTPRAADLAFVKSVQRQFNRAIVVSVDPSGSERFEAPHGVTMMAVGGAHAFARSWKAVVPR